MSKADVRKAAQSFDITVPMGDDEYSDSLQLLGSYLLFGTKWDAVPGKPPFMPKNLPVISEMPRICDPYTCPYKDVCPVIQKMSDLDRYKLVGTRCRAEREAGVKLFAAVVKDLDIEPTQTIDVLNAANMVRLMIYRTRLDWEMASDSMQITPVTATNPITGEAYREQKEHPLLKAAERLDKMIESAGKSLVASRKDRLNLAAQLGKGQDFLAKLLTRQLELDPTLEED